LKRLLIVLLEVTLDLLLATTDSELLLSDDSIQDDAVLWALLDVAGVGHLSYEVGISNVVDGLLLSLKDSISQTSQLLQVCL
jgi:hypothetical protein